MTIPDEVIAAGFDYDSEIPSVFIQWKGADVCMDFHCDCGAACHYDGDFAYYVTCPHCKQLWQMPYIVYPRKVLDANGHYPKDLMHDEDWEDDNGNPIPVEKEV